MNNPKNLGIVLCQRIPTNVGIVCGPITQHKVKYHCPESTNVGIVLCQRIPKNLGIDFALTILKI